MSVVDQASLQKFDATVKAWFADVRVTAEKASVAMAFKALSYAARVTPQYSGAAAANWKLAIGSPDTSFEIDPLGTKGEGPVSSIGGSRAVEHAKNANAGKLASFQLGQTIYLSNSSRSTSSVSRNEDDEKRFVATVFGSLAVKLEEGKIKLRPINEDSSKMARRAIAHLNHHYGKITKANLQQLMRMPS